MKKVQKENFNNSWYKPGKSRFIQLLWYFVNQFIFQNYLFPFYGLKKKILTLFGAKIGKRFIIKPNVNIKYPWRLKCGDFVSLGEGVWIDNLTDVMLDNNVTISQGAYLCCGNHDYKSENFDLMVGSIQLKEGVWIGAKAVVGPGVIAESHTILTLNSVALQNLEKYSIYQGNPAIKIRDRVIL